MSRLLFVVKCNVYFIDVYLYTNAVFANLRSVWLVSISASNCLSTAVHENHWSMLFWLPQPVITIWYMEVVIKHLPVRGTIAIHNSDMRRFDLQSVVVVHMHELLSLLSNFRLVGRLTLVIVSICIRHIPIVWFTFPPINQCTMRHFIYWWWWSESEGWAVTFEFWEKRYDWHTFCYWNLGIPTNQSLTGGSITFPGNTFR